MNFHDAHNHLHDERFGGRQPDLIADSRAAGVSRMVVNGSSEQDWPAVAGLAARYPDLVIPAFGLHPWYVHERSPAWFDTLRRCLDAVPGSVVGEIGLDRWILETPSAARTAVSPDLGELKAAPLEVQVEVFELQFAEATRRVIPSSIHCLQAWGRLHQVLLAQERSNRGFLLHSYGGPVEMVGPLARLGARFGFPGYFLHGRKLRQREAFRAVPPDRLLIETDAPDQRLPARAEWVSPADESAGNRDWNPRTIPGADGRGLNHPANLGLVYRGLADFLGTPIDDLAGRVAGNFHFLFEAGQDR